MSNRQSGVKYKQMCILNLFKLLWWSTVAPDTSIIHSQYQLSSENAYCSFQFSYNFVINGKQNTGGVCATKVSHDIQNGGFTIMLIVLLRFQLKHRIIRCVK